MKKILFVAHGNNDLDHYMPLIYGIKKYRINLIYIPDGNSTEISKMHLKLLSNKDVRIFTLSNFLNSKILISIFFLYSFLKKLNILSLQNRLLFFLSNRISFLINKVLNTLVFSKKLDQNFKSFFLENSIELVIIDLINQKKDEKNNIFKKSLNSIFGTAKKLNIPLFMISHGVNILFDKNLKQKKKDNKLFLADRVAICNKFEIFLYKHLTKNLRNIKILGDIRFDISWINYLKKINQKKISQFKNNKKIKILYIMGNLTFLQNSKIEEKINFEIKKLTECRNVELWVKIHPKANTRFNFSETSKLKVFNREMDISILIQSADIVLTTHSGVITETIISDKINVLYDSWKENCKKPWTIFDETKCVIKVKNFLDLKILVSNYKKIKKNRKHDIEKFFKKYISGNRGLKQSLIKDYLSEIDNLIIKKKNVYN